MIDPDVNASRSVIDRFLVGIIALIPLFLIVNSTTGSDIDPLTSLTSAVRESPTVTISIGTSRVASNGNNGFGFK